MIITNFNELVIYYICLICIYCTIVIFIKFVFTRLFRHTVRNLSDCNK